MREHRRDYERNQFLAEREDEREDEREECREEGEIWVGPEWRTRESAVCKEMVIGDSMPPGEGGKGGGEMGEEGRMFLS